jgi:hypothetical protein
MMATHSVNDPTATEIQAVSCFFVEKKLHLLGNLHTRLSNAFTSLPNLIHRAIHAC